MLGHPARMLALGLGSGLSPWAPGTAGTLWAWAGFCVLDLWLTDAHWAWVITIGFIVGVWACQRTGRDLGVADHSGMVWDEVIAFWLVLWVLPREWHYQLIAFGIFRLFDITKPPPIRALEARWKNGFGVMADDLLAAAYTLLIFALWGV
jgi:phosphatidylglycerophosphatase A